MDRVQVMAVAVVLAAGLPLVPCMAQVAESKPAAPAVAASQRTLDQFTSNVLVRLALMDLRTIEEPAARDYRVTLSLLKLAQGLMPEDANIARGRAEAAWNAGDQDELMQATQTVVRLDPSDAVATLRLITERISSVQTAEDRVAMYEQFLGPRGQSLDASIRSRLALDAALLLRERGDDAGFIQHLKLATQLDVTNKEAAYLAYDYYHHQSENPAGRLELLSNMLMADPMDARVLLEIRDLLAAGGSYKSASRFHDIASRILRATGTGDAAQMDLDSLVLQWRLNGPRPALDLLLQQLASARRQVDRTQDESAQTGLTYSGRAEDVRLGTAFEEARMGTALALNNDAELGRSLLDFGRSMQQQMDVMRDRTRRPTDVSEGEAVDVVARLSSRLECWRVLVKTLAPGAMGFAGGAAEVTVAPETPAAPVAPDPAPVSVPAPDAAPAGGGDDAGPVLAGWRAIGAGDMKGALSQFDDADEQNDIWVLIGRAVAIEKTVADGEAARAYHAAAAAAPLTVLGAIASSREADLITKLGGSRPNPETDPAALDAFAKTIPAWIDVMVDRPWTFQSVRADPVAARTGVLDQVSVRVKVRNLSPVPLGVGSGRPINSRLLFNPAMEVGGKVQVPDAEVLDIGHRLRLMPNEEMECVVWPEAGMVGYVAQASSEFPSRVSWRVLQGFEASTDQTRSAGPGCVEVSTTAVLHEPLAESRLTEEDLAGRLLTAGDGELPGLLVAAQAMMNKGADAGIGRVVDVIVQRYPSLSTRARMLVAGMLPPTAKCAPLAALDERIAKETDPGVLEVALVARAKSVDDPILAAAAAVNDAGLAVVVTAQRSRLTSHLKTYSQVGPPENAKVAVRTGPGAGGPATGAPVIAAPTPNPPKP